MLAVVSSAVCAMLFFASSPSVLAHQVNRILPTPIPSVPAPQGADPIFPPSAGVPAVSHAGGGAVTVDDVRAFVTAHGFAGSHFGKTTAGAAPAILQVSLMTWKQADVLLKGDGTRGRVATAGVIYVKLQGPFLLDTPVPPAVKLTPVQTGEELFDARSGNLLMVGSEG